MTTHTHAPAGSVPVVFPPVARATDMSAVPVPAAEPAPPPARLALKDLVRGRGREATRTSIVTVQYLGADYTTGSVFYSSWARGGPVQLSMRSVIPGFAQGVAGMRVGGRREVVVPSRLGYGTAGSPPDVAPDETLVLVVDLLDVS